MKVIGSCLNRNKKASLTKLEWGPNEGQIAKMMVGESGGFKESLTIIVSFLWFPLQIPALEWLFIVGGTLNSMEVFTLLRTFMDVTHLVHLVLSFTCFSSILGPADIRFYKQI